MAAVVPRGLRQVIANPNSTAAWLSSHGDLWGTAVEVLRRDDNATTFEVEFTPPPQIAEYPVELVRILVRHDGEVFAVPVAGDDRSWKHRNSRISVRELVKLGRRPLPWESLLGSLCLWYPRDPARLRWTWRHGLDGYLRLTQRHLWNEEYHRRNGEWVGEDVPHGERPDGRPHPIMSRELAAGR